MEIVNVGNFVLAALLGLVVWIFNNERSSLKEKIETNKTTFEKEIECIKADHKEDIDGATRKHELLEAKFYEFENEKYTKIMDVLSGIKADIAVIKNEIDNLKKQKV